MLPTPQTLQLRQMLRGIKLPQLAVALLVAGLLTSVANWLAHTFIPLRPIDSFSNRLFARYIEALSFLGVFLILLIPFNLLKRYLIALILPQAVFLLSFALLEHATEYDSILAKATIHHGAVIGHRTPLRNPFEVTVHWAFLLNLWGALTWLLYRLLASFYQIPTVSPNRAPYGDLRSPTRLQRYWSKTPHDANSTPSSRSWFTPSLE